MLFMRIKARRELFGTQIFLIGELLSNFSISRLNPPFHGGSNDNIIPHAIL